MAMDMNFPHPRQATRAEAQKADYSALIASASSRQATSRTVSALLTAPRMQVDGIDALDSRIAFFAFNATKQRVAVRGAFWPAKFESAVNPAGSNKIKCDQSEAVKPELQVAERGTEF
jgi:hypothetical protein